MDAFPERGIIRQEEGTRRREHEKKPNRRSATSFFNVVPRGTAASHFGVDLDLDIGLFRDRSMYRLSLDHP